MKTPLLFIGHGSPTNTLEDNKHTAKWREVIKNIPKPKAILMISAHWQTNETLIFSKPQYDMIYDMYGFADELYEFKYNVKNDVSIVEDILNNVPEVKATESWGLDHGAYSVLNQLYPDADIPVLMLSTNRNYTTKEYYELGKKLSFLREQDVLVIASGNIVHNLGMMNYNNNYQWASDFRDEINNIVVMNDIEKMNNLINNNLYRLAHPSDDHLVVLWVLLGLRTQVDQVTIFNDDIELGSIAMTSYLIK